MKSLRVFDGRHMRYAVLAFTLVLAAVAPAFASAEQLTTRSAALSSSSKGATAVSYNFKFTAATAEDQVVIQFCTNSPLIGEFCDAPGGLVLTGATAGAGVTSVDSKTGSTLKLTAPVSAGTNDLTVSGITNPSAAGTIYARVLTYNGTGALAYDVDDDSSVLGSPVDQGSVAISITDTVAVSGAVLEALTFCVSGLDISADTDCANSTAPVLKLGEDVGDGTVALSPSKRSTGNVYTKISTNAVSGAAVSLKSTTGTAGCAGLALNGTGACNIAAAGTSSTILDADTDAKFGLIVGAPASDPNDGTINIASNYSATNYHLDGTAVTSTYGDPLFNTDGGYANNRNVTLTFGAKSANNTPAGKYSTAISLIATGTF